MSLPLFRNSCCLRLAVFLPALFALAALTLTGCGRGGDSANSGTSAPANPARAVGPTAHVPFVEVVQSKSGRLPLEYRLSGIVRARNEVVVFPEFSGRIAHVAVDDGDMVAQGDLLVRMESRQLKEQLTQARANLRLQEATSAQAQARQFEVETELRRIEQLAERQFVSELELARQQAQVEIARAESRRAAAMVDSARSAVEEREYLLSRAEIRSPVNGLVGRRDADLGMRVDANTALFVVGDLSEVRVTINLSERMAHQVRPGTPVFIHSQQLPAHGIAATVTSVSPFLASGSFSAEANIRIPNPDGRLRSGMLVDVNLLFGESDPATLIPISALHENPRTGKLGVFVATEADAVFANLNKVVSGSSEPKRVSALEYREVEVLARGRQTLGVTNLQAGEWVVAVGHDLVFRGGGRVATTTRVRAIDWDNLLTLQSMQREDIVELFIERHRRLSATASGTDSEPAS